MRWLVRLFLLLGLVALAVPSAGVAKPRKGHRPPAPKSARYMVVLRGSQATTWHSEAQKAFGACAASEIGDGDQMIRFHSDGPGMAVIHDEGAGAAFVGGGVTVEAEAERGGEFRWRIPNFDPGTRQCVGTRELPPEPMPGCGARTGTITVHLGLSSAEVGGTPPDEELAPLERPNQIHLRGLQPNFGGGSLGASLPTCPLLEAEANQPASIGELYEAAEHFPESRLFTTRHAGRLRISASAVTKFTVPTGYGQTAVTYNLTLVRLDDP